MGYNLAVAISKFTQVVYYLILARVIMSWVVRDLSNPIARFIYQVTEPILAPCRELLNKFGIGGRIDFSPIVVILGMQIIANALIRIIL